MALKLTKVTHVKPHSPLRDQLADQIRRAIDTGDLQPGERLPSENEIAPLVGVDRATVGRALTLLFNEGLILRSQGKPTTVAPPAPVRIMDTRRYAVQLAKLRAGERSDTAAFVEENGATWDDYTVDQVEYDEQAATEKDATYLGIKVGANVMRRRMIKLLKDEPIQIQRSTVPLKLARGTVLADPKVQPYPGGTLAELYDAKLIPDGSVLTVFEEAGGSQASVLERRLLDMKTPGWVWDIVRIFSINGIPIEVSRVIAPMTRMRLGYETTVS